MLLYNEHPLPSLIVEHRRLVHMADTAFKHVLAYKQRDWLRLTEELDDESGGNGGDSNGGDDDSGGSGGDGAGNGNDNGNGNGGDSGGGGGGGGAGGEGVTDEVPPRRAMADRPVPVALHCQMRQTHTVTGRLSTDRPNLQCLPHTFTFVSAARYTIGALFAEPFNRPY